MLLLNLKKETDVLANSLEKQQVLSQFLFIKINIAGM